MQQLTGKAVSPGYASGTAFIHSTPLVCEVPCYKIAEGEVAAEHVRFLEAVERSFRELKDLERRVLDELGESNSAIFAAHLDLLEDKHFVKRIKARVQRDLINIEHALHLEIADLCNMLASVESEYISERAQDIRDVGMRVLRQLAAQETGRYMALPPQSIIIARELLPSETLDLDRDHVAGIVTEEGGENSHAAILARALGIPAVTGIAGATTKVPAGAPVLIDGERGIVSVAPTKSVWEEHTSHKSEYDEDTSVAIAAEDQACVTRDGLRISLLGNINRPHESHLIDDHHLDGVGLYRTEFLFLESTEPPSFERQVEAYRQLLETDSEHPVVIRTLDLGGDKLPLFLSPPFEGNPNLGLRGLRFSLAEKTLFETQVRAIITAARGHQVRILLPMVLGAADLSEAVEIVRRLAKELGAARLPEIGAMIETPAALFALDEIFTLADFACVGTNDLTQFMLAADRNAVELVDDYSVLHPSVLRAIARVIQAGDAAGRDVSVCGEVASYPRSASLLVGMGVRQLSMSPIRAARVRYWLRRMQNAQLAELAERALQSKTVTDVRELLEDLSPASDKLSEVS